MTTTISLRVNRELSHKIKAFAKENKASVNAFLTAIIEQQIQQKEHEKAEMEAFYKEAQRKAEKMFQDNSGIELEAAFNMLK